MVPPSAPHLDPKEYLVIPPSPNTGIGGIPGSKDFLKSTTDGFQDFRKPVDGTVAPRSAAAKTAATPTATTPVPITSTAVTTVVSTTRTTTSLATNSNLLQGRKDPRPQISVSQMSQKKMDAAHAKLAEKANLNTS